MNEWSHNPAPFCGFTALIRTLPSLFFFNQAASKQMDVAYTLCLLGRARVGCLNYPSWHVPIGTQENHNKYGQESRSSAGDSNQASSYDRLYNMP